MTKAEALAKRYDLIAKATAFFEAGQKIAHASGYVIGSPTCFTCECQHSVRRESIFGKEVIYSK